MPPSLHNPTPLIHPIHRVCPDNIGVSLSQSHLLHAAQSSPKYPSNTTERLVRPKLNNGLTRAHLSVTYPASLQLAISSRRWGGPRGMSRATGLCYQALPYPLLLKTVFCVARTKASWVSVAMSSIVRKLVDSNFNWLPF